MTAYDPCCGSGGLLIKSHLRLLETRGVQTNGRLKLPPEVEPLHVFGQEINPATFAIARMNAVIHDIEAEIALGDTMNHPRFTDEGGHLRRFDLVAANPATGSLSSCRTPGRCPPPPTSSALTSTCRPFTNVGGPQPRSAVSAWPRSRTGSDPRDLDTAAGLSMSAARVPLERLAQADGKVRKHARRPVPPDRSGEADPIVETPGCIEVGLVHGSSTHIAFAAEWSEAPACLDHAAPVGVEREADHNTAFGIPADVLDARLPANVFRGGREIPKGLCRQRLRRVRAPLEFLALTEVGVFDDPRGPRAADPGREVFLDDELGAASYRWPGKVVGSRRARATLPADEAVANLAPGPGVARQGEADLNSRSGYAGVADARLLAPGWGRIVSARATASSTERHQARTYQRATPRASCAIGSQCLPPLQLAPPRWAKEQSHSSTAPERGQRSGVDVGREVPRAQTLRPIREVGRCRERERHRHQVSTPPTSRCTASIASRCRLISSSSSSARSRAAAAVRSRSASNPTSLSIRAECSPVEVVDVTPSGGSYVTALGMDEVKGEGQQAAGIAVVVTADGIVPVAVRERPLRHREMGVDRPPLLLR